MHARDCIQYTPRWRIAKFADDDAFARGEAFETSEIEGNLLLNEGITRLLNLLAAGGGTAYDNANARLGVGDGAPSALTGTLTFTNGSAAVTGAGTAFDTELAVGDFVHRDNDGALYEVQAIGSATSLTLTANFAGTTGAGAGSKILRAIATQTDLQASTNKVYAAMEATYPQVAGQAITFRAVFGSADANYAWRELSADNGAAAGENLNRKVTYQGTKVSGQTWTLDLQITFA